MAQETDLLNVSEARRRLLAHFPTLASEAIPLSSAVGRVLAEPIISQISLPSFDTSAMDGFAVYADDTLLAAEEHPISLKVVEDIPAGKDVITFIHQGQAARIMTGAKIPPGADAVVPVEWTDFNYRQVGLQAPEVVGISRSVRKNDNIRRQGDDLQAGEIILESGHLIRPQDAGLLSMVGKAELLVHKKPRVAIFSTGDELLPVEAPLEPGKIHDANMYTLIGQVEQCGAQAINLGIIADHPEDVRKTLNAVEKIGVDLILSSAGVSVGAMDFVRHVIEKFGHLEFWRVNMRPGKPFAFGYYEKTPFIGLPGNPVSAFVGFEVFVRPVLQQMLGEKDKIRKTIKVKLVDAVESDGRESYLRAVVTHEDGLYFARLTGHQGSGNLRSLVQANAMLLIPSGVKSVPSGGQVDAWFLDGR